MNTVEIKTSSLTIRSYDWTWTPVREGFTTDHRRISWKLGIRRGSEHNTLELRVLSDWVSVVAYRYSPQASWTTCSHAYHHETTSELPSCHNAGTMPESIWNLSERIRVDVIFLRFPAISTYGLLGTSEMWSFKTRGVGTDIRFRCLGSDTEDPSPVFADAHKLVLASKSEELRRICFGNGRLNGTDEIDFTRPGMQFNHDMVETWLYGLYTDPTNLYRIFPVSTPASSASFKSSASASSSSRLQPAIASTSSVVPTASTATATTPLVPSLDSSNTGCPTGPSGSRLVFWIGVMKLARWASTMEIATIAEQRAAEQLITPENWLESLALIDPDDASFPILSKALIEFASSSHNMPKLIGPLRNALMRAFVTETKHVGVKRSAADASSSSFATSALVSTTAAPTAATAAAPTATAAAAVGAATPVATAITSPAATPAIATPAIAPSSAVVDGQPSARKRIKSSSGSTERSIATNTYALRSTTKL